MTKDTRERFTLRMPTHLYEHLQTLAEETGVSLNALILQILKDFLDKNKAS